MKLRRSSLRPADVGFQLRLLAAAFAAAGLIVTATGRAADRIDDAAVRGCEVHRDGHTVRLVLPSAPEANGSASIPRFSSPVHAVRWQVEGAEPPTVHPEPQHWVVRWRTPPADCREIVIEFDEPPVLPTELAPIVAAGDGSLLLPACRATTAGTALRYEPQPHKNTVGYWTVASDAASWEIECARPGTYAVAILQGCGAGHGGSTATLSLRRDGDVVAAVPFTTIDTGHFQNFRWLDIGTLTVPAAGRHVLSIAPDRIAKAALCDIRAVSLVPQAAAAPAAAR
jgi:hypothetical protein